MLPSQVAAVLTRLFAIWLGLSALRVLPSLLITGEGAPRGFVYGSFFFTLTGAIALALWFFPHIVAGKLASAPPERGSPGAPDTWLAIGCALVGLWMLTYAMPALIRDAFLLQSSASDYSDTANIKSWMLYDPIEVAIALWLVFGATGFRQLFWWARSAGVSKSSENGSSVAVSSDEFGR